MLLKALGIPHLPRYQQKLTLFAQMGTEEERAAAAAGQRIPSLASITSLDLSGLGGTHSEVFCDALLAGCPHLTHLVRQKCIVQHKQYHDSNGLMLCRISLVADTSITESWQRLGHYPSCENLLYVVVESLTMAVSSRSVDLWLCCTVILAT